MFHYNKNPDASDSLRELKKEVLQYRENVIKSYESLMDRGEKINLVVKKADSLKHESGVYYGSVSKLTLYLILIFILIIFIFLIF